MAECTAQHDNGSRHVCPANIPSTKGCVCMLTRQCSCAYAMSLLLPNVCSPRCHGVCKQQACQPCCAHRTHHTHTHKHTHMLCLHSNSRVLLILCNTNMQPDMPDDIVGYLLCAVPLHFKCGDDLRSRPLTGSTSKWVDISLHTSSVHSLSTWCECHTPSAIVNGNSGNTPAQNRCLGCRCCFAGAAVALPCSCGVEQQPQGARVAPLLWL